VGNMRFDPRNRGCSAAERCSDRILLVVVWSAHVDLPSSDMFRRVRRRRKVSPGDPRECRRRATRCARIGRGCAHPVIETGVSETVEELRETCNPARERLLKTSYRAERPRVHQ
jgi:hypothetical protein